MTWAGYSVAVASASSALSTSSSRPPSPHPRSPTQPSTRSKPTSGSRPTPHAGTQSPSATQSPRNGRPLVRRCPSSQWSADHEECDELRLLRRATPAVCDRCRRCPRMLIDLVDAQRCEVNLSTVIRGCQPPMLKGSDGREIRAGLGFGAIPHAFPTTRRRNGKDQSKLLVRWLLSLDSRELQLLSRALSRPRVSGRRRGVLALSGPSNGRLVTGFVGPSARLSLHRSG